MEISLYGQGQLIQGLNNSIDRIIQIFKIFDREQQQYQEQLTESKEWVETHEISNNERSAARYWS